MFENLGLALKVLRERAGFTQSGLAQSVGMGKGQMSKYENGKELPKLESLERLLRALGTSPLAFFHLMDLLSEGTAHEKMLPMPSEASSFGPLFTSKEAMAFKRLHDDLLSFFCAAVFERSGAAASAAGNDSRSS